MKQAKKKPKKFEEDFPSLEVGFTKIVTRKDIGKQELRFYLEQGIQEYCLDKHKVREVINAWASSAMHMEELNLKQKLKAQLIQELGLE